MTNPREYIRSVEPIISVIVPVYNPGARLRACLDSLLAQTFKQLEIIAVNDGSTDGSGEICREYAQKHPDKIMLIDGPNGGVCVARNKGLDAAKGEWIGFCDSDDVVRPDFCEYMHSRAVSEKVELSSCALARGENGEGDISMNVPVKGEAVWGRKQILDKLIRPLLRLDDAGSNIVRGYITLSLFKRKIIEDHKLRFTPGMLVTEDEAFYFEYLQFVEHAALSDRVLYHYIETPQSACHKFLHAKRMQFTKKEKFWCMRWQQRYRVFKDFGLARHFPEAAPII